MNANVTAVDMTETNAGSVENSINLKMVNLELSSVHEEVDFLQV